MNSSLFAAEERLRKIDKHKDSLLRLDQHIDFSALAAEVDRACPRPSRSKGGRPPFPTELMVRILVIKSLWNLSDEQAACQLLDRVSFQRFTGLENSSCIPDAKTIWAFNERLSQAGAADRIFSAVDRQLYQAGYWSRGGQMVDATIPSCQRPYSAILRKKTRALNKAMCQRIGNRANDDRKTPMRAGQKNTAKAILATKPVSMSTSAAS